MPGLEQHDSAQSKCAQAPPLDVLNSAWGANAQIIQRQTSNAMDQFGQFCIGFGDGLNHFATETTQSIKSAISDPTKTIQDVSAGGSQAIKATAASCAAGANYLNNHISHNDLMGGTC